MLCALNVSRATAHPSHDTPAPICEHLECDDLDEMRLEHVAPSIVASPVRPVPFSPAVITVLHLSPVIFQPPEAA